jgi:hypothetical protein
MTAGRRLLVQVNLNVLTAVERRQDERFWTE